MIVIDASYALALVMPDEERPPSIDHVLGQRLITPMIWPLELANAMRNGLRRGRLLDSQLDGLCGQLDELSVEVASSVVAQPRRHLEAARQHDLTPYDALYLELALQRRCGLATGDAAMAAAAGRAGIPVYR